MAIQKRYVVTRTQLVEFQWEVVATSAKEAAALAVDSGERHAAQAIVYESKPKARVK